MKPTSSCRRTPFEFSDLSRSRLLDLAVPSELPSNASSTSQRLLLWPEIPIWQQDNEYILSGYRPTSRSVRASIASLSYLNNQTVNAYSHLIGAVIFVILPVYFYQCPFKAQPNARLNDLILMVVYCSGVAVCFAFSAAFHILWNHSYTYAGFCNKLDYLGILVLMWGAGIPMIYYGFPCNHGLQLIYWMVITGMAMCCTCLTLYPQFALPKFRHWRAGFYTSLGISFNIVFVVHGLVIYGWEVQKTRMSLEYMRWAAISNLAGARIYAARVPERYFPYHFDVWGASHQMFHVAVTIAAWIHFRGIVEAFHTVRSVPDMCSVA